MTLIETVQLVLLVLILWPTSAGVGMGLRAYVDSRALTMAVIPPGTWAALEVARIGPARILLSGPFAAMWMVKPPDIAVAVRGTNTDTDTGVVTESAPFVRAGIGIRFDASCDCSECIPIETSRGPALLTLTAQSSGLPPDEASSLIRLGFRELIDRMDQP